MQKICVYCASSTQINPIYFEEARQLGKILADENIELVYGGGSMGLMGEVANSVLNHGGKVIGVIPQFMCDENWNHDALSSLIITSSMHERKEKMAMMADAVVALPGGCGTLEELLEVITWKQLGIFTKPIIVVNTNHYYDDLISMLKRAVNENFMREIHSEIWSVVEKAEDVIEAIHRAPVWDNSVRKFAAI